MKPKAFTLIEVVMTLVLLSIVIWIGIAAMFSGMDTWSFFTQRKDLLGDGRMAMDRMLREIRMLKDTSGVITANSNTFRFVELDRDGDSIDEDITFTISSGVINMTEDGVTNGLLGSVSTLSFTYYDADGSVIATPVVAPSATNIRRIRILIAMSKGTSRAVNLRCDVWPRNLK